MERSVILSGARTPFVRPGVRAVWHRSNWPLGVGAGFGAALVLWWLAARRYLDERLAISA